MSNKNYSRRDFLRMTGAATFSAMTAGLLSACGSKTEAAAEPAVNSIYTPGTYTAGGRGHVGEVSVSVTFDETHITEVVIDAGAETPTIGGAASEKLVEQIMAAQSSAIDGISGATETTNAVRTAVAECIKQASGGIIIEGGTVSEAPAAAPVVSGNYDWLGEAPEIAESDIVETVDTEILVVGAGNSGLMAAAKASSLGAKVFVIEKAIASMNERHWIGAVDTTAAKEAGIEVDKNKLVVELCRYASHRCDERIIRLWTNHSGEAIDWYYEQVKKYNSDVELHVEYDLGAGDHEPYYVPVTMHNFQDNIPEHDYSEATSTYGLASLTSVTLENGGEIRYSTSLVKLERNNGKVTGAIAKNEDGKYIRINASKGVALCCGGYAYNKEMLATLNPDAYISTVEADASANDTGDGIKAAMWIGADKDPDATAMLFDRGTIAPDQFSDGNWQKSGYFHLGSQPFLKVNLNGERFANESQPYDFILHAAFMEPHHLYNTIYDSTWFEQVAQFQQIGCARIVPSSSGGKLQIFSPEAEHGLLAGMEAAGFVQRADTIEELAEKLNLPVDTFVATVARYNELCEKGVDEDFGKESYRMLPLKTAPFFGCRQGASLLTTLDGLRINTKMQVLDKNGDAIEGLYAAGDCSGGFFAHNYPEYIVGVAVGRTLTEGYLLGEGLASI